MKVQLREKGTRLNTLPPGTVFILSDDDCSPHMTIRSTPPHNHNAVELSTGMTVVFDPRTLVEVIVGSYVEDPRFTPTT